MFFSRSLTENIKVQLHFFTIYYNSIYEKFYIYFYEGTNEIILFTSKDDMFFKIKY